ncbi:Killer cell lectin-like receptor subfamily B member 1 [Lemmus lemmus]
MDTPVVYADLNLASTMLRHASPPSLPSDTNECLKQRLIQDFSNRKGHQFSIGLKYVPMEKTWKWINGSDLNRDQLQVTGKEEENSCALISGTKVFSDTCSADNRWICQKKLKHD